MARYWAFISYSHRDEAWARWLQHGIETYRVPKALVRGEIPARLNPVFRDRDELAGASDLSAQIQKALEDSRYLVVLCSPHSARSPYVNQEIRSFGRPDRVLSLIVDGEPAEAFPPALTEISEPIAADARDGKDGKPAALLKILAGLIGVGLDELVQRERRRQRVRRVRNAVGIAAGLAGAALLYVGMADAGLGVPGGEALRRRIDRHEGTLFRPVRTDAETAAAAASLRERLVRDLRAIRSDTGLFPTKLQPGGSIDVWSSAQTLAALGRAGEDGPVLAKGVDGLFADLGEDGWRQRPNEPPQGAILMWVTTAAAAARHDGVRRCRDLMRRHAGTGGGWSMFPENREPPWDTYTTALALQALLALHDAGTDEREAIRATADALIGCYDAAGGTPGWRRYPDDTLPDIYDGMTLQIGSLLLRAETLADVRIPGTLMQNMTRHLIACGDRGLDFPVTKAEFEYVLKDRSESEAVGFLWHPWAIENAALWLRRAQRVGAAREDIVGVRRALGHLVVDLGPAAANQSHTFAAAELLYCLGEVR